MTLILLLTTTAWLAIMVLVVTACRMAARADRELRDPERLGTLQRTRSVDTDGQAIGMPRYVAYRLPKENDAVLQTTPAEHVRNRTQQDLDVGP
jgi:hypothetical protein